MRAYVDHINLWENELRDWLPDALVDVHVHLCPADAMADISAARRLNALTTFDQFTWEQYSDTCTDLFGGKAILALFAFPLPLREVDRERANDYILATVRRDPRVHGFLLADPVDPRPTIEAYRRARRAGGRILGVKPYYDLLGKSNVECTMPEFVPEGLLEFMDARELVLMLHTSGIGIGDKGNRAYLRRLARRYPRVKVILAHMGRYIQPGQFFDFLDSGLLEECPNLFLDLSSATVTEVYVRFLMHEALWSRLLFASDLPFGLITGVERWSETHGPIFLARDHYPWSDPAMAARYAQERTQLTYNTYHCIKALKDAVERLGITGIALDDLKRAIFSDNALREILGVQC